MSDSLIRSLRACAACHPNRVPWTGKLVTVDVPSDRSPRGARGHTFVIPRLVAKAALPSLIGMGLNCALDWDTHDVRCKCGIITHARIVRGFVVVGGFIYARDFPKVVEFLRKPSEPLGMSLECADVHISDMRAEVWECNTLTFTGAAVGKRKFFAYQATDFEIVEGR